jgi:PhzF family phenazine biosynthesis protein
MASRRFIQCDVFTTTPTKGNGLAVVVDCEGLSDAQMQSFAAWTNLAETTFLLPPPIQRRITNFEFLHPAVRCYLRATRPLEVVPRG